MKTKRMLFHEDNEQVIKEAVHLLTEGELVAFPTETVYGLGANAMDETAVEKVFAAKGRPSDNPLIIHVANIEQLKRFVAEVPHDIDRLIRTFSPGPITYILRNNYLLPSNVTANLHTIAVRIPDHPIAQRILEKCDFPIAAPSANLSGKPSPTLANHVFDDLDGKIAAIIDGGSTTVGVESTVIDCTGNIPVILRLGAITTDQIKEVTGNICVETDTTNIKAVPKSPGLKYKHYAPAVPLIVITKGIEAMQNEIDAQQKKGKTVGLLASNKSAQKLIANKTVTYGENLQEIALHLYDRLRSFHKSEVDIIICEAVTQEGVGKTIMDRLIRAAHLVI